MAIPFTQYLLPHGRRKAAEIERPEDIEAIAQKFIESGGRYECEVLTTGHVSLTAVKEVDGEEDDVAIAICQNEPGLIGAKVDEVALESQKFLGS